MKSSDTVELEKNVRLERRLDIGHILICCDVSNDQGRSQEVAICIFNIFNDKLFSFFLRDVVLPVLFLLLASFDCQFYSNFSST